MLEFLGRRVPQQIKAEECLKDHIMQQTSCKRFIWGDFSRGRTQEKKTGGRWWQCFMKGMQHVEMCRIWWLVVLSH